MSETARALGEGNLIEWRGKTYTLAPFKWKLIGRFEAWCKARAWNEVEADRGTIPEDVYRERHNAVTKLIVSLAYKRGGQLFADAISSFEGIRFIVWLRISENDPTFTQELCVEMFDEIGEDVMNKLQEQDGNLDPNAGKAKEAEAVPTIFPSQP